MNGIFSLKFLNKVSFFVKTLNKNDRFSNISKQRFSLQNSSILLKPFSSLVPQQPYQSLVSDWEGFFRKSNLQTNQLRTVTKFSYQKGARKTAKPVPQRFFRLRWGIWIRTIAGRHKKLWQKTNKRKNALLSHVFCNQTQSKMLDKMVNRFWRVPKYYIEDPYEPYHTRENFVYTKKKPRRPEGVDYE